MVFFDEFTRQAPIVSEVFTRRHRDTHNLCMLGTTRADGSPRISPMEPRIVAGHLVLVGMPGTRKFDDLGRDPRFCLHTATEDPQLAKGDAKLFGQVQNLQDAELHRQFTDDLFEAIGMDLRNEVLDPFYVADITSASSLVLVDGPRLEATIWNAGEAERVVTVDE